MGPLGKGFLAGTIDETTTFDSTDFRNIVPRFTAEARAANQQLVELPRRLGEQHAATPAQIALGWPRPEAEIIPIPGTTKLHRLEEDIGALTLRLTAGDLIEVTRAAAG